MAEYETEEQQVEALKQWWKENGLAVVGGAGLGIAALFGWYSWNNHQENLAIQASDIFGLVQDAVNKNDETALQEKTSLLQTDFASTPYASLAVLHHAKMQHEKGEYGAAQESLNWVISNSKQENVQAVARIRLARLLLAENKFDEAQAIVANNISDAYSSLANEVQGDIYVAKGEIEQAKQAYDKAMQGASGDNVEFLALKRNDLGS